MRTSSRAAKTSGTLICTVFFRVCLTLLDTNKLLRIASFRVPIHAKNVKNARIQIEYIRSNTELYNTLINANGLLLHHIGKSLIHKLKSSRQFAKFGVEYVVPR